MPRQPKLDTPGALHHVMGRGINGLKIFGDKKDCEDFLDHLRDLCEREALSIYAWVLWANTFISCSKPVSCRYPKVCGSS